MILLAVRQRKSTPPQKFDLHTAYLDERLLSSRNTVLFNDLADMESEASNYNRWKKQVSKECLSVNSYCLLSVMKSRDM